MVFKNKNPKHCIYNAWDEFQNEKIRGTTQIRENLSLYIQTYATPMITEAHPVEAYLLTGVRFALESPFASFRLSQSHHLRLSVKKNTTVLLFLVGLNMVSL